MHAEPSRLNPDCGFATLCQSTHLLYTTVQALCFDTRHRLSPSRTLPARECAWLRHPATRPQRHRPAPIPHPMHPAMRRPRATRQLRTRSPGQSPLAHFKRAHTVPKHSLQQKLPELQLYQ